MTDSRIDDLAKAGVTYTEPVGVGAMNVVVETTDEGTQVKWSATIMGIHGGYLFVREQELSDPFAGIQGGPAMSGTRTVHAFTLPEVTSVTGLFTEFDEGETFEDALIDAGFLFDEVGNIRPEGWQPTEDDD